MITLDQARTLSGKTMRGAGGEELGQIDALYADRENGDPTFATVHSGAFGTRTHFVPLADATLSGDTVTVPYDRDLVTAAPDVDPDAELEPEQERRLYSHYGVGGRSGQGAGDRDTSGPTTDSATARSRERLDVGTQQTGAGRAGLREDVVTERGTGTVPVRHEDVGEEQIDLAGDAVHPGGSAGTTSSDASTPRS